MMQIKILTTEQETQFGRKDIVTPRIFTVCGCARRRDPKKW